MSVTVKVTGDIKLDVQTLAKKIAPAIIGRVLERTAKGIGSDGKPFREYAPMTRERYRDMGESADNADLRLTGGLLNSVHLKSTYQSATGVLLVFGPDTGTSPQVAPPEKGKARAVRTGERGPPHNLVGLWIHNGRGRMPARPWLGLSPADNEWVRQLIQRTGIFVKG
jgi:hypothetical protein